MRLSLLLPARKHLEAAAAVAHWLVRGDRMADAMPGRESALRGCFDIGAGALPIAALTRSVDADDAAEALWLRADPAFVMADAVTLRLLACGNLGLASEEIETLAQALKPLFDEAGFVFDAAHPQRWYLRCPRDASPPKFSSPDEALGDDLSNHLPAGADARRWRSLLNEVQIVLTQHPVNAQRARRGLPPVNSLWFWGAGVLPQEVRCGFDQVVSDDAVVVALAGMTRTPSFPRRRESGFFSSGLSGGEKQELDFRLGGNDGKRSMLIDLADQRDMAKLDEEWFAPIADALKRRQIAQLDLLFESGERFVVKTAHRWRFWRRVKTTA